MTFKLKYCKKIVRSKRRKTWEIQYFRRLLFYSKRSRQVLFHFLIGNRKSSYTRNNCFNLIGNRVEPCCVLFLLRSFNLVWKVNFLLPYLVAWFVKLMFRSCQVLNFCDSSFLWLWFLLVIPERKKAIEVWTVLLVYWSI